METLHGTMATDRPERYAKQLLSHWSTRGPVSEEHGVTVQHWDDGRMIRLEPMGSTLDVEVSVPEGDDVRRFAEVVARHLERFGAKDELEVDWED